jgi:hypothetical protein
MIAPSAFPLRSLSLIRATKMKNSEVTAVKREAKKSGAKKTAIMAAQRCKFFALC